jgi:hypothetical protein
MSARASLAELAGADIHLHPAEAVAIVAELCRRHRRGMLRGVPSPSIIRLSRDGDISVEGPIPTEGPDDVARMAQLLSDILPGFGAAPRLRARGGLRLVIARALGTLDLPPYDSLQDFGGALERFAAADLRACVRGLVAAWEGREGLPHVAHGPLTISDVRRARRATGLTLDDIATVADVPAAELRSLEWGDLRAWPRTAIGRDRIARYARAAGLDEQIVLSVAWPLVSEDAEIVEACPAPALALLPPGPRALAALPAPAPSREVDYRLWLGWAIAAVALVLLAVTTFALVRERALRPAPLPPIPAPVSATQEAVVPLPSAGALDVLLPIERESSAVEDPRRRGVAKRDANVAPVRRAPARTPPPQKKPLLQREILRIVFR